MDKKTAEVLKFLSEWNDLLTESPIDGSISEIYFCFVASSQSKGKDKVSWLQFIKCLNSLNEICNGNALCCKPPDALHLTYEDPFKCFNSITYINRLALALITQRLKKKTSGSNTTSKKSSEKSKNSVKRASQQAIPKEKDKQLNLLMNLIDCPSETNTEITAKGTPNRVTVHKELIPESIDDIYTTTSRSKRLNQLECLLSLTAGSNILSREKAKMRTPVVLFYDCCEDNQHAQALISLISFDRETNYCKLDVSALSTRVKFNPNNPIYTKLSKCVNDKIHFIPIIQPQTDSSLGDCSYLDTCHKMHSCRYVHYGQLMPQNQVPSEDVINHNDNVELSLKISDYTRGEITSPYSRPELPAQWINCDVTKLDFSILGNNFAVIIADPSWTIHMNLNYSSLTDSDLLSMRMDLLQQDGLFLLWVTGRTIETGRDFLKKWGYDVKNQLTWVKTNQLIRTISTGRTGHWLNHSKEHLLVGMKGEPKWLNKHMDPQILISSTRETSRKPDEIYGIVDRLVGPRVRKLEIFGRQHNTRPGWFTIGNQLDGTHIVEKEIAERYYKSKTAESAGEVST